MRYTCVYTCFVRVVRYSRTVDGKEERDGWRERKDGYIRKGMDERQERGQELRGRERKERVSEKEREERER